MFLLNLALGVITVKFYLILSSEAIRKFYDPEIAKETRNDRGHIKMAIWLHLFFFIFSDAVPRGQQTGWRVEQIILCLFPGFIYNLTQHLTTPRPVGEWRCGRCVCVRVYNDIV